MICLTTAGPPASSTRHTRERGLLPSRRARPAGPSSARNRSPNGSRDHISSSCHAGFPLQRRQQPPQVVQRPLARLRPAETVGEPGMEPGYPIGPRLDLLNRQRISTESYQCAKSMTVTQLRLQYEVARQDWQSRSSRRSERDCAVVETAWLLCAGSTAVTTL
jgi:hypothetical protein